MRPSRAAFYAGRHVLVTGASTGLGRAFAAIAVAAGARVTIVSRNPKRLEEAREWLQQKQTDPSKKPVCAVAADVTQWDEVRRAVAEAVSRQGDAPSLVVTCAGLSHPGYFADMPPAQFADEMRLNYMGTVHALKACLAELVRQKPRSEAARAAHSPHFALVSSAAAIVGFIGYSAYCPTKYALRGLADTLRNELQRHGVAVSIFFPSSIDTPGYAQENLTKPEETREIEGTADLLTASQCADLLDDGLRRGQYAITTEPLIEVSRAASNGLGPRNNFPLELFMTPLLVFVQQACMMFFDSIVAKRPANAAAAGSSSAPAESSKKQK